MPSVGVTDNDAKLVRSLIVDHPERWNGLKQREQLMMEMRFGLSGRTGRLTHEAIGAFFSLSRERVRQLVARSLKILRTGSQ